MRPHQWVKNLFVLAPLVFAKDLFDGVAALRSGLAFIAFSFLASAVYVMNDLADVEADRAHPVKKHRPIASGEVPEHVARGAMVVMASAALLGGFLMSPLFAASAAGYLVLNIFYSLRLKRVAYVDVLCIATGFELRVVAGSFAAEVEPSTYLLLLTFLLASYLGLGKRMHELTAALAAGTSASRRVLRSYNVDTLRRLLYLTGGATIVVYVMYTLAPKTRAAFGTDYLVASSVCTLFGVLRFMHLVQHRPEAESPTEEMLRDRPFLLNLAIWAGAVVAILYFSH